MAYEGFTEEGLLSEALGYGAKKGSDMMGIGAMLGSERMCRLGHTNGGAGDVPALNKMLHEAAHSGHENICRLARAWGASDYKWMLREAIGGGHVQLCRLAREWGAVVDADWMLYFAAGCGRASICHLAREWGATDVDRMLAEAARAGREELCRLAHAWGATDYDRMRRQAAVFGRTAVLVLAAEWQRGTPTELSSQNWVPALTSITAMDGTNVSQPMAGTDPGHEQPPRPAIVWDTQSLQRVARECINYCETHGLRASSTDGLDSHPSTDDPDDRPSTYPTTS